MYYRLLTPVEKEQNQYWINHFTHVYDFKFYRSNYDQVPHASQTHENVEVSKRLAQIEEYLLGSHPIDMGTNVHEEMRDIRNYFSKDESDAFDKLNKLGTKRWGVIGSSLVQVINSELSLPHEVLTEYSAEKWATLTFEEKMLSCSAFDSKLFTFLQKLYF